MLKEISDILVAEGFPRFILTDDVLDVKAKKKQAKLLAKSAAAIGGAPRVFENAVKACALKDIILRWLDLMKADTGKRYFYRPVAALKSGHKGAVEKALK
jgi:hypothetical protein